MGVVVGTGKQDSGQLSLHLNISQIRGPFLGHDDYVSRRQPLLVASKKLPQEPLDPVALEGFASLAPHHQTQPGAFALPWGQADAEMRGVPFFSPGLGPEVLPATTKPLCAGKAGRLGRRGGALGAVGWAGGLEGMLQRGSLGLTPRGACDPWPGDAVKSGVRPWSSCGPGSRGCGPGGVYSADKFAS
jgi:hypothetical protein